MAASVNSVWIERQGSSRVEPGITVRCVHDDSWTETQTLAAIFKRNPYVLLHDEGILKTLLKGSILHLLRYVYLKKELQKETKYGL